MNHTNSPLGIPNRFRSSRKCSSLTAPLESFATKNRDKAAALRFMKKAMKRYGKPEVIVTDGLRSYGAAMTEMGNLEKQEVGRWLNNRVENSHLPFRRRERAMLRFRQMKTLQKFSSGKRGQEAAVQAA